ncbi:MAG: hypothetical protein EZS28_031657 [Streblomastix strix]|uniref:Uncharacterized protein n=1 Tax=Streblomastix strix TaxID=222440 RepID=A0A5J4UQ50_9EUKA|nr:MAG: hypothetical protein EZS28_031657 [Streblomastix strix]
MGISAVDANTTKATSSTITFIIGQLREYYSDVFLLIMMMDDLDQEGGFATFNTITYPYLLQISNGQNKQLSE